MKKIFIAIVVMSGIYACNNPKSTDQLIDAAARPVKSGSTDTLTYTYDSVKVYSKARMPEVKHIIDTTKAVITYPVFSDEVANKFLMERIVGMSGKQESIKTYNDLTTGFVKEFDTFYASNPDAAQRWFQLVNVKMLANYSNYLSMLVTYSDYKGGAHPNTLFTYLNYSPKSYQPITLDSLITAEGMPKLRALGERIFRKNEKLDANTSLSKDYFFIDGVFSLPQTFTVTKEGLQFLYNPYEIKPYVFGTTELIIPFSEIKDIMKDSSILTNFR